MSTAAKKVKSIVKPKAQKKGVATQSFPNNAPALFAKRPKVPEADNVGRKFLPTAHAPKQAARARRAAAVVKRLSGKSI